jgi:putative ABC transport system permease protein
MFSNYFISFLRFTGKYKSYSFNNILGLSVGMACAVLIYLWILDELSFDTFHENYDNIYRIVQTQHYEDGDFYVAATPGIMAPTFEDLYPEIIETARFRPGLPEVLVSYEDKKFYEYKVAFADKELFKLFSFPFVEGSADDPFPDINSLLITEHIAEKYFGDEDPIGKTIYINNEEIFTINGVLKNVPANSHLQFDILGNFEILESLGYYTGWNNNFYYGYALLQEGVDYKTLGPRFDQYMRENELNERTNFWLQPLSEVHLHSDFDIDVYSHTEPTYQYISIFYIIGVFIILIAIINYINLSTARSTRRALEVAVRKVNGARRSQLIRQFMGESFLLAILSYLIAMLLVELALPAFNHFTGKEVSVNYSDPQFTIGMIILILFSGFISGGYPALFLSSYNPVQILKGDIKAGPAFFRRILVIIQFSIAIMMIICTGVVYHQLMYIQNINLGLDKELVLYSRIRGNLYQEYFTFKQELLRYPGIKSMTYCSNLPTYNVASTSGINWEGKSEETNVLIHRFIVDHDYIPTFGIKMAAGRNFSLEHPSDSGDFILNESAIHQMEMEDPVGKRFTLWDMEGKIIGIMKDFNYKSLHKEVEPLCMYLSRSVFGYIYIKIDGQNVPGTLKNIEKVAKQINPFFPMDFRFINREYEKLYTAEEKLRSLFTLFALLAVFLSSLGLIGLTLFLTEKRTKEIGIRKAMGSNTRQIIILFSWDTLKWILVSNIIAWPAAWWYMDRWLNEFAFKTEIKIWIFVAAGIMVLFIAILSVGYQALRVASVNPAISLKYE